jgi:hypothetical protein
MTTEAKRKNPDYTASAVNLVNPPEIGPKLMELQDIQARWSTLDANLQAMPEYQELQEQAAKLAAIRDEVKQLIDTFGSYQNIESGFYAVKQRKESMVYQALKARANLPVKLAELVIIESVDAKALDGLVKGGLVTPEQARKCGEVKETFAYIIR